MVMGHESKLYISRLRLILLPYVIDNVFSEEKNFMGIG